MAVIERSITINVPAEKAFAYLVDPHNEMEMNPYITEIRNVTGDGPGQTWFWTIHFKNFVFTGKAEVTEFAPCSSYATRTTGNITSAWEFRFTPQNGMTLLDLRVDYDIPIPLFGRLAEVLSSHWLAGEIDKQLCCIKKKIEA